MLVVIFLYFLTILVLLYFFRNKLLHPISLTILYWSTIVLLSELNHFIFKIKIYHWAIIPIILFLASFTFGAMFFYYKNYKKSSITNENINIKFLDTRYLTYLIIIFSIFGLTSLYMQLKFLKVKLSCYEDIYKIAYKISILRYSNKQEIPLIGKILQAFIYSGSYFGGYLFLISKNLKNKSITTFPLLTSLLISIINGVKMLFIVSIIFWISAFISNYIIINKGKLFIKFQNLLIVLILSFLFLIAFINIHKFRSGDTKTKYNYESLLLSYFSSYNVFSLWWQNYDYNNKPTLGKYTFSGIHNFFYKDRKPGIFTEFVILKEKPFIKSNVYTIFRYFIEDYSFIGTIIIFIICGYLITLNYEKLFEGYWLSHIFNTFYLTILLNGLMTFLLTYNIIIISWLIIFFSIIISKIKIYKDKKKIIIRFILK